jgi:hypothetical protein
MLDTLGQVEDFLANGEQLVNAFNHGIAHAVAAQIEKEEAQLLAGGQGLLVILTQARERHCIHGDSGDVVWEWRYALKQLTRSHFYSYILPVCRLHSRSVVAFPTNDATGSECAEEAGAYPTAEMVTI